jgi:hypothetical protein
LTGMGGWAELWRCGDGLEDWRSRGIAVFLVSRRVPVECGDWKCRDARMMRIE